MSNIEFNEKPKLNSCILVGAWTGWPDAAEAATRALKELISQLKAKKFASIDAEQFYVFSTNRPNVKHGSDGKRILTWPENDFYYYRSDWTSEHDIIFVLGEEPDLKWREYVSLIGELAQENNCKLLLTVGALLDSVPHTRQPRVMGTIAGKDLGPHFKNVKYPKPNYEGPSGITSALIEHFEERSIPSVSIWGHAPHYVQVPYNPNITMAILEEIQQFIPSPIELGSLKKQSDEFTTNLIKALEGQKEIAAYVEKLEERYDSENLRRTEPEPRELMADLEAFLHNQRVQEERDGEGKFE